ncbi:uncharacterized protein G2W53_004241 [Senna tora]|uniref:Uncharacterized protein n=1 Tax=Senna tora TaxID=362788 RepID=A0A834XA91_9FABA|nr:uncharacterized protein G2W53_004241 [Senna tora]
MEGYDNTHILVLEKGHLSFFTKKNGPKQGVI